MNPICPCVRLSRRAVVAVVATILTSGSSIAQTSSSDSSDSDASIITLSPFEVRSSVDDGYQPKNTNSVSGISQELKNLPFNIEIFGEDLIAELGATDLNSVVSFAANVNGTEDEDGLQRTASFRGITSNFTRRNQFIWYNPSDSFSLGRVEIIRGPSSLLYGQGEPGGLVNTQSKQANVDRNFGSITNSISDWGQFRNTIDLNLHAGDRFGVRVAGVYEDSDTWRDELGRKVEGEFVNAKFLLSRNTKFTAEYEHVTREDMPSSGILMWNPTAAEWTRPADAPQSGNVQLHLLDALGDPRVAYGLITKENSQSWSGANRPRQREWEATQATLDHQFNKHFAVELGYNVQEQDTFVTGTQSYSQLLSPNLTNGSTIDDEWRVEMSMRYNPSYNEVKTARARAVLNFDLGGTHHDLVMGGVHRTDYFDYRIDQWRLDNGTAAGALRPAEVYYIKDGIPTSFPDTPVNPVSTPSAVGYVLKPTSQIQNEETLKAGYAVLMSRFMDDRIHTLVGYRFDDLYKYDLFNDAVQFEGQEGSTSAGINYSLTPEVTAYFNYSESFKAPGAFRADFNNDSLAPAVGSGKELGLKFDLLDNRVSGLVTVFTTDFDGNDVNTGGANSGVRNTVDPAGLNGRHGGFFVPSNTETKGVELQFTAKVTPQWSVTFGYGYADARSKDDVEYQINWNDGYEADAAGNPLNADGAPLMRNGAVVTKSDIQLNAQGNISNATALGLVGNGVTGAKVNQVTGQPTDSYVVLGGGEKTDRRNEHNLNLITRYSFRDGRLKGVAVGGYARTGFSYIRGYIGSVSAGDRQIVMGDDLYIDWGFWASYSKKFEKVKWTTRVQIDNPFDEEHTLGGYNSESWNTPRQVRWSNTISF